MTEFINGVLCVIWHMCWIISFMAIWDMDRFESFTICVSPTDQKYNTICDIAELTFMPSSAKITDWVRNIRTIFSIALMSIYSFYDFSCISEYIFSHDLDDATKSLFFVIKIIFIICMAYIIDIAIRKIKGYDRRRNNFFLLSFFGIIDAVIFIGYMNFLGVF